MRSRPRLLMTTAFCLLGGSSAFGSYAASNLGLSGSDACQPYTLTESSFLAGSFRTGNFAFDCLFSGAALSIASGQVDTSSTDSLGQFRVELWESNDVGVLMDVVTSLSPVENLPGNGGIPIPGLRYFQADNSFFLKPSSIYWISAHVREGSGLKVGIERTDVKAESEILPDWSIGDQSYIFENGRPRLDAGCVPLFAITVQNFPEPAPTTIALLGTVLFWGLSRRPSGSTLPKKP